MSAKDDVVVLISKADVVEDLERSIKQGSLANLSDCVLRVSVACDLRFVQCAMCRTALHLCASVCALCAMCRVALQLCASVCALLAPVCSNPALVATTDQSTTRRDGRHNSSFYQVNLFSSRARSDRSEVSSKDAELPGEF